MSACLDDDEILDFVAGTASPAVRDRVADHVADCAPCRVLVAQMAPSRSAPPLSPERPSAVTRIVGEERVGETVGRYELKRLLGAGGAGLVFEALDPHLNRRVALKLVRQQPVEEGGAGSARLLREAQAMAALWHPSVVAVFDAGLHEDGVFIAMELVEGKTLASWLREEKPDWRSIVKQFVAAGQGLVAAHAARLVHRDFKAENVLIGADGRPRVTDFGLARPAEVGDDVEVPEDAAADSIQALRSQLHTLTQSGLLAGTPAYMAPEQFKGAHADEATDQFNFSASLFAALYGAPPFAPIGGHGDTVMSLARAVLAGRMRPPPPGTPVPAPVHAVLVRGLAYDRSARFPSMAALLAGLEQALEATSVRPGRRRVWTAAAAVGLLALGGLGLAAARTRKVAVVAPAAPVVVPAPTATVANAPASERVERSGPSHAARPIITRVAPPAPRSRRAPPRPSRPDSLEAKQERTVTTPVSVPLGDGLKDPYGAR